MISFPSRRGAAALRDGARACDVGVCSMCVNVKTKPTAHTSRVTMASAVDADGDALPRALHQHDRALGAAERRCRAQTSTRRLQKIQRATLLRNVIKAKLPDVKGESQDNVYAHVHGLLDATFPRIGARGRRLCR